MNDICVKTENLSKYFSIFKNERTAFRTVSALIRREPLKIKLWALRDVSFEVRAGDKLAVIGGNGSGKTTLLRILTNIYDKTSGAIYISEGPKVIFKHAVGFSGDLNIINNIYLYGAIYQMDRNFLKDKIQLILEKAQIYDLRYSLLKELSQGQIQRLALSIFFLAEGDLQIFDEAFAFLDQAFMHKCDNYFRDLLRSDKTAIIASHDTSFLRKYCTTAIWLDKGRIRMQGGVNEVIDAYENCSNHLTF